MKNKNLRQNSFWQAILFAFFISFLAYFIEGVPIEICLYIFVVLTILLLVIAFIFIIPALEANYTKNQVTPIPQEKTKNPPEEKPRRR